MINRNPFRLLTGLAIAAILASGCAGTRLTGDASLNPAKMSPVLPNPPAQDYRIQAGDQLNIRLYPVQNFDQLVVVRPDGKISLQLLDDIQAAGLTPQQLDRAITQGYSAEFVDPKVTVTVTNPNSEHIFVGGEVRTPGVIKLTHGMTPLQAIIFAGGSQDTANLDQVIVIRKGPQNQPIGTVIDVAGQIDHDEKAMAPDLVLQRHDIVYVPKTTIAELNVFVNQYVEKLLLYHGATFGFSYFVNPFQQNPAVQTPGTP